MMKIKTFFLLFILVRFSIGSDLDESISVREFEGRLVEEGVTPERWRQLADFAYHEKRIDLLAVCANRGELYGYFCDNLVNDPPNVQFRDDIALMLLVKPTLSDYEYPLRFNMGFKGLPVLRMLVVKVLEEYFPEEDFDSDDLNYVRRFGSLEHRLVYFDILKSKLDGGNPDMSIHHESVREWDELERLDQNPAWVNAPGSVKRESIENKVDFRPEEYQIVKRNRESDFGKVGHSLNEGEWYQKFYIVMVVIFASLFLLLRLYWVRKNDS